jgi:hypothetical protein
MSKKQLLVLTAFSIAMIAMAIVGAIRNYSPVPWWDMWGGTLQFYIDVQDGNYSAWWKQHNEHRIVLARLLFWLDYQIFGGRSVFLIAMNYLFSGCAALVFWRYLRQSSTGPTATRDDWALGLFVAAWLFLWAQENNFTWGFQGQFFLAQLLPLSALFFLALSVADSESGRSFILACILGVLSIGTMANGLLALPLMAVYAILLRMSVARIGLLAALAASGFALYFADYHSPGDHGTVMKALREYPVGLLQYTMLYVGSPFHFLLGEGDAGRTGALWAGISLVAGSAWLSWHVIRAPREHPFTTALLLFILYVGGTALGAGAGRYVFGVDGAVSSRYTTPAIMAWSAFFVALHVTFGKTAHRGGRGSVFMAMVLLGCVMVVEQVEALKSMKDSLSNREIAALALALDIDDPEIIPSVYPVSAYALHVARTATERKLSVFGQYPYADLRQQLGKAVGPPHSVAACVGHLDRVEDVRGVTRFVRIHGWIYDPASKNAPRLVRLVDHSGLVVGFALTGTLRADVAAAVGWNARRAGFRGYMFASSTGDALRAVGDEPACLLAVNTPAKGQ